MAAVTDIATDLKQAAPTIKGAKSSIGHKRTYPLQRATAASGLEHCVVGIPEECISVNWKFTELLQEYLRQGTGRTISLLSIM